MEMEVVKAALHSSVELVPPSNVRDGSFRTPIRGSRTAFAKSSGTNN